MNVAAETLPAHSESHLKLGDIVGALAAQLTNEHVTGPGDLADLRRLARGELNATFWRVLTRNVPESWRAKPDREDLWAALFAAFAAMAVLGKADQHVSLGHALATTGYAEPRLLRLLRADSAGIGKELDIVARWLVVRGQATDWRELAAFAFSRLTPDAGSDHETARRIARDYFTAVSQNEDSH